MILYVNGDSHTAAAEAVNAHAFAEDDSRFFYLGRAPHPANLAVSWGRILADLFKSTFKCDAESASSNARIMRTLDSWLQAHQHRRDKLVIVQWSTWERQEWLIDGTTYQINASGLDHVPESHQDRYRQWIADVDWQRVTAQAHDEIWKLHQGLLAQRVPHVFFNGNNHFGAIPESDRQDWGVSYISPYSSEMTFNQWLLDHGYHTVAPNSWHFGADAHAAWARFMLQYCVSNQLVP